MFTSTLIVYVGFCTDGEAQVPHLTLVIFPGQVNDYFSRIEDEVQRSSFDGRSRRAVGSCMCTGITVICGAIGTECVAKVFSWMWV